MHGSSNNQKMSSKYVLVISCVWMVNFMGINQTVSIFPFTILVWEEFILS